MPKIRVKRKKRRGSFLSRYNFAQAGRDTINTGLNTIKRIDPSLIENAKKNQQGIAQILGQSGKELGRVSPVILKKAIERKLLHKTPFRLLEKFSRKKNMYVFRKLDIIKRKLPTKSQG